jgi:hypothetical protein
MLILWVVVSLQSERVASYYAHSLSCCVTTLSEGSTSKLWLLCVLCMTSGWILTRDQLRWWCTLNYICCSLLVKSVFCLPCIHVLNVIILMAAGSFLLSSIPELLRHCYGGRLNKQTMTVSFSLNDKWMYFNMQPMEMIAMDSHHCPSPQLLHNLCLLWMYWLDTMEGLFNTLYEYSIYSIHYFASNY